MKSSQQEQFQERMMRLAAKQPGASKAAMQAAPQQAGTQVQEKRSVIDGPVALIKAIIALVMAVISFAISLAAGVISLTLGRLIMVNFVSQEMLGEGMMGLLMFQYGHIAIALLLLIVLLVLLNLGGGLNFLAACLGLAVMQFAPGLIVMLTPEIWAWLFSPGFVFEAITQTYRLGLGADTLMQLWVQ